MKACDKESSRTRIPVRPSAVEKEGWTRSILESSRSGMREAVVDAPLEGIRLEITRRLNGTLVTTTAYLHAPGSLHGSGYSHSGGGRELLACNTGLLRAFEDVIWILEGPGINGRPGSNGSQGSNGNRRSNGNPGSDDSHGSNGTKRP